MTRDDAMVLLRAFLIALLIVLASPAFAGDFTCPKRYACWQVRAAVKVMGEGAAESHVRACGWSEAKINEAKRCLIK